MKLWLAVAGVFLAAAILLTIWIVPQRGGLQGPEEQGSDTSPPLLDQPYIRATHWFGEAWPVNFWNTDLESLARDHFQLMIDDGFNTVVFLVPWPGFAPDPTSGELEPERVERLRTLMLLANEMELKTIVRLSYAWDWLDRGSGKRLMQLWLDEDYRLGWLQYIEALWQAVGDVPGLQFGFFSWEDLWAVTSLAGADEDLRRQAARQSGFARWLVDRHGLESAREQYGLDFDNETDVIIPQRRDPAYALFLEFVSEAWIDRFYEPARERFPALSMEVRLDSDPIYDGDRIVDWFDHRPSWELPGAEWVTLYWSPAMGGENRGEELSPNTAAERLAWWLDEVAEHAGPRQIFIGQFLFEDFTPGYEDNGRIPHRQLPEFLAKAGDVLRRRAGGVGLWAWADYGHDAIGNPEFFSGLSGWEASPEVELNEHSARLEAGAWIATGLARFAYSVAGHPDVAELCISASASKTVRLSAYLDEEKAPFAILEFDAGTQRQCVEHELAARRLRLESDGIIFLDRINSIGFVQRSGIRDRKFELKTTGLAYRELNAGLQHRPRILHPRHEDGWMGRVLLEEHRIEEGVRQMHLQTYLPQDWPESPVVTVSVDGEFVTELTCGSQERYRFDLPSDVDADGMASVRIESSHVHRPGVDARQLGCHIVDLSFSPADDRPNAEPDL